MLKKVTTAFFIMLTLSLFSCTENDKTEEELDPIKGTWQLTALNGTSTTDWGYTVETTKTKAVNIDVTYQFLDNNILVVEGTADSEQYDADGNLILAARGVQHNRTDYWEVNEDLDELYFAIEGGFFEEYWEITSLTPNKIVAKHVMENDFGELSTEHIVIMELER
ncbi:hypothetical protein MY04_2830 [Flammeovirga sp. MY04]|uniref:hypothetical protein n=1 Tax=Flammeovirga sp. MY04 TaxID=1191459 RepID=UPI0008062130|nr:hypothetical protein [Flammeovirga sp. MY04]ANQ50198.1 hypothetical protein MY04_2830 [Flammeovirga sp. MY04]